VPRPCCYGRPSAPRRLRITAAAGQPPRDPNRRSREGFRRSRRARGPGLAPAPRSSRDGGGGTIGPAFIPHDASAGGTITPASRNPTLRPRRRVGQGGPPGRRQRENEHAGQRAHGRGGKGDHHDEHLHIPIGCGKHGERRW
jgi:hypothetical protein